MKGGRRGGIDLVAVKGGRRGGIDLVAVKGGRRGGIDLVAVEGERRGGDKDVLSSCHRVIVGGGGRGGVLPSQPCRADQRAVSVCAVSVCAASITMTRDHTEICFLLTVGAVPSVCDCARLRACMRTLAHMCAGMYVCMCVYMHVCTRALCACVHECMHTHMCVCVYARL